LRLNKYQVKNNIIMKYTIQFNYNASIAIDVEAKDEGEALSKAREMAEEADIKEFSTCGEREAQILRQA
jgi:hypothetical protein